MSDKVQLIKEEIERRMNNLWYLIPEGEKVLKDDFTKDDANNLGKYTALENLLHFIDSLPEDPASENLEEEFNRFLDEEEGVPRMWHSDEQMEWGKDIAHHFAEWQRDKDAVPSCKSLYNAIKEEQEKKSFHDDFEKASYAQGMIDGSMWQKQQMKEVLQTEYEKGRFDMREEMMKDAVEDCSVIFLSDNKNWLQIPGANLVKALEKFKQGDKVKIIIVKTE